jgi:nitric oxide reductase subunit B
MRPDLKWDERVLKVSFWCFNIGLAMMALFTLLPMGTLQLLAAIDHGYWYARSEQFMQQPIIELLIWMRVPGDTVFSIGALALTYFVARLWLWPRQEHEEASGAPDLSRPPEAVPVPAE